VRSEEFETIAPRIFGEEATRAGEGKVVGDLDAVSEQCLPQFVEIVGSEGGVGFLCGAEVFFDADVNLLTSAFEPATPAKAKRLWFLQFSESKERAVKLASGGFTSFRSGNLNVIDSGDAHFHRPTRIPACGGFYSACEFARAIT